jgi:hypothetical protein
MQFLLAISLLHLPLAEAFAVIPSTHRVQCRYSPCSTQLRATVAPEAPKKAAEKKEKLTKEAQELLNVIDAKEHGDPETPLLLAAQVAPAVR